MMKLVIFSNCTNVCIIIINSVKVDLVFVDEGNKPIDAVDSVKTLQDRSTQDALASNGVTVANVEVPEPLRPEETSDSGCKCELYCLSFCTT